jgi:membrane protein DedA with SNARE-associated domain
MVEKCFTLSSPEVTRIDQNPGRSFNRPVIHLIHELAHTLLTLFHTYELPTLFLATLIEESGVPFPIPADTLMVLAGSQFAGDFRHAILVIGVSSLAVFIGSSILFMIMYRGGRPLLVKYGHYLHLSESHLESMEGWFVSYGRWTIIVARLIPGLRIVATVIAGISGMSYADYVPVAIIAAVVWSVVYYALGAVLGHELPIVRAAVVDLVLRSPRWEVELVSVLVLLAVLAAGGWLLWRWRVKARQPRTPAGLPAGV